MSYVVAELHPRNLERVDQQLPQVCVNGLSSSASSSRYSDRQRLIAQRAERVLRFFCNPLPMHKSTPGRTMNVLSRVVLLVVLPLVILVLLPSLLARQIFLLVKG